MKRKDYQKPTMQIVQLKQQQALLAGSLGDPDDYGNGGDPFNSSREFDADLADDLADDSFDF